MPLLYFRTYSFQFYNIQHEDKKTFEQKFFENSKSDYVQIGITAKKICSLKKLNFENYFSFKI